jgi:hypothetical protein
MTTIEMIIRQINRELVPQFEEHLRAYLAAQERDWLIEQIVRLALDAHSLHEMDRKMVQAAKLRARAERIDRLRAMALNPERLAEFLDRYRPYDRARLIQEGYLLPEAPAKGGPPIGDDKRTPEGNRLLQFVKDMLFGLLFGDEQAGVSFDRRQRELLTFALPRYKSGALDFMKAATELSAAGTWQDPESAAHDDRADNLLLEVEFGEIDAEQVGHGIVRCLSLINNLEVNEQVLYARMINIEQSTLIE